jgi:glutathione S-transferase
MLTVHHLSTSQSERILWLCEELGVPYQMKRHERDAVTRLSPPELQAMHPMGTAPVIEDGDLVLAESGAIVDYIIGRYGNGRLSLEPAHPDFAQYLYWFHFANATFQPLMGRNMVLSRTNLPAETPVIASTRDRLARALKFMDARLSEVPFLAGNEFTAADIMIVFSLTTMRIFYPLDLAPYAHIKAYLQRMGAREPYQRAMAKGDPEMKPMLE